MAKTRAQKEQMLADYKSRLQDSMGIIVLSQSGIKPHEVNEFKLDLAETEGSYSVVKNSIFRMALEQADLPELETFTNGPNSVVFTSEDVAATAKVVADFVKKYKNRVEWRAGILDGQALSVDQVKELSELPTKEQSVAMIAGILQQNISGVANVLEDSVRSIAIILDKAFSEEK